MQNTFGYVDFCNLCHKCTYLKNDSHKYCGVVTPCMQYNSAYEFAVKQNKAEWRPHFVNIQSAVNACHDIKFELSLDTYLERQLALQELFHSGDVINLCHDADLSDDSAADNDSVDLSVDDSVDDSPTKKQKLDNSVSLPADVVFDSNCSDVDML